VCPLLLPDPILLDEILLLQVQILALAVEKAKQRLDLWNTYEVTRKQALKSFDFYFHNINFERSEQRRSYESTY